jgi:ketosteroid isomerase-like protein
MVSEQVSADFQATNQVFENEVVAKGNYAAIDRVYTKNARILPPGAEMITGRENIRGFWKEAIAGMGVASLKLSSLDVEVLGDTAIEVGRAEINTGTGSIAVKYVVVWKREDGAWKWHVDIWNPAS